MTLWPNGNLIIRLVSPPYFQKKNIALASSPGSDSATVCMHLREMKRHECVVCLQHEEKKNDVSARYLCQGISGCMDKLSNNSKCCKHRMVTFCACTVNLYQATRLERGVAWRQG